MSDATPFQKVTQRLKLKGSGPVFAARCPAHDDRRESLSVAVNPHGDVLLTCHAGCDVDLICDRLGVEVKDLFWPKEAPEPNTPDTIYVYRDERGEPLLEVHKSWDKRFKQKRAGAEEWGLGDVRRVPYRLPELLRAKKDVPVFILEGEKDVENAMARLGLVATCNLGGAGKGKWKADWNEFFAERNIVVIPDNDDVGRAHADEIRKILEPVANSVVVVHLPKVAEKGDLSDWLKLGGTRRDLEKLVEAARLDRHPHVVFPSELHDAVFALYNRGVSKGMSTGFTSLDEFYTVRLGEWTVITGAPGAGKSTFADHLCLNLALSRLKIGVFSAENLPMERHAAAFAERYVCKPFEPPQTQFGRPRMEERELEIALTFIEDWFTFIEPQEQGQTIDDILDAAKWMVDKRDCRVILLDPWTELNHDRAKSQTETEFVGESLWKVRRFARNHEVHFIIVAHPSKMQRGKDGKYPVPTLWDISGSAHWNNMVDCGLVVYRDTTSESNLTEIHVQKIRFKEVGHPGMVQLQFDKPTGRFSDLPASQQMFGGIEDDE